MAKLRFLGVMCILAISQQEYLIGSGDGMISLVTHHLTMRGKKPSGAPKMVQEPTKPCLKEVRALNLHILNNFIYFSNGLLGKKSSASGK